MDFSVPKETHKTLWIRSFVGTCGFTSYVYAIKNLPMGLLMILFNTAPFWASLLAWVILREVLKPREICAMVLAFAGIVIIALSKPPADDSYDSSTKVIGCACAITVSFCYAVVSVTTRKM